MKHFSTFWKILLAITFYARNVDAQSFEKLTDLASLKAGDELLLVYEKSSTENYAMSDSIKGNTGRFRVPVTIKDSKIHDLNGAHIILLGGKKNYWTLYDTVDCTYLSSYKTSNPSKNILTSYPNIKQQESEWRIEHDTIKTLGRIGYRITSLSNSGSSISCVSNTQLFRCYSNVTGFNISIFRKVVSLTMSAVGYATLYYGDRALLVPEGVTAHTLRVENDQLVWSKTYAAGATIPQATGVVLKGQQGSYTFKISQDEGEADAANMLKGTDEAATTTGGDSYFFLSPDSDNTENVGFFWGADNGGAFTNGAHKAYLAVPQSASAKRSRGYAFTSQTTGVDALPTLPAPTAPGSSQALVNLWGQQVSSSYKGIVIKNGKKYIMK